MKSEDHGGRVELEKDKRRQSEVGFWEKAEKKRKRSTCLS